MNLFRGIMLTAVVLSSPACADRAEVPSEPAHPKNVILVLIDTLRADHTAIHGYPRPTTPILEQLAEESVVFDRARSQAGCTFPSMNSLLTSRYPFDFYRREPGEMGIPVEYPSIAEVLKAHGYITVAVSASPIVRATPSEHNPSAGFGRGFDIFDEQCLWREAACVNRRALEIIENLQEPFFLYLHYMDPHDSYEPPKTYQRFAGPYEGFEFIAAGDPNPIGEMLYDDGPNVDIDDQDIKHLVDLYDDEILYVDTMLGEFLRSLRGTGALDDSIFILTSDHGEEFLEHGHVKHCRGVWDTLTRVPLLIRFPQGWGAQLVNAPVQLVDLLPTVLDALDLSPGRIEMEGISLLGPLTGQTPYRDFAFSDQVHYRSVDDGRHHLILDGLRWKYELFDTASDPLEQHDLVTTDPGRAMEFEARLKKWLTDTGQWKHFDMTLRAAEQQKDQLRALGYLE